MKRPEFSLNGVLSIAFVLLIGLTACSEVADNDGEARRLRDAVLAKMNQVYETKSVLRMHLAADDAKVERMMNQEDSIAFFTPAEEELYEERALILMALEREEETLRLWIVEEAAQDGKSGWWPSESARAQSRIRLDRITQISQSVDSLLNKSKKIGRNRTDLNGGAQTSQPMSEKITDP